MRRFVLPILLTFLASSAVAADLEANKKTVLEFYEAGLNKKDFEAAAKYFGPKYIQHNPGAPDGTEAFEAFVNFLKEKFPNSHSEIKKVYSQMAISWSCMCMRCASPARAAAPSWTSSGSRTARSLSTGMSRRISLRRCRTTTGCFDPGR